MTPLFTEPWSFKIACWAILRHSFLSFTCFKSTHSLCHHYPRLFESLRLTCVPFYFNNKWVRRKHANSYYLSFSNQSTHIDKTRHTLCWSVNLLMNFYCYEDSESSIFESELCCPKMTVIFSKSYSFTWFILPTSKIAIFLTWNMLRISCVIFLERRPRILVSLSFMSSICCND